jgi:hypothetical protein
MEDAGQVLVRRVVNPAATRTQELRDFAADVRAQPAGTYLDAGDIAGEFETADSAKSFAWRVNHGRSVAFRPAGHYLARTEGNRVGVTYLGPRPQSQQAS